LTLELGQDLVGVLVQVKGRQRWFQPSQNRRIAASSSATLAKSPRVGAGHQLEEVQEPAVAMAGMAGVSHLPGGHLQRAAVL
jgi:hypothetical protein